MFFQAPWDWVSQILLLGGGGGSANLNAYAKSLTPYLLLDVSVASSVTLNGGNCSQLNDLSGNGRHFYNTNPIGQPAYNTNPINGKAVLSPNGVDRALICDTFAPTGAMTFFAIYRVRSLPNIAHALLGWGNAGQLGLWDHIVLTPQYQPYNFSFDYPGVGATAGIVGGDTPVGTDPQIVCITYGGSNPFTAASYVMKKNGADVAEALSGGVGDTGSGWTYPATLFARPNGLYTLECDLAFLAVFSSVLSAAQIATLTALAKSEYGIA